MKYNNLLFFLFLANATYITRLIDFILAIAGRNFYRETINCCYDSISSRDIRSLYSMDTRQYLPRKPNNFLYFSY